MAKKLRPSLKRAMNPLVTLRAKTVPNKKRVQNKLACRKKGGWV